MRENFVIFFFIISSVFNDVPEDALVCSCGWIMLAPNLGKIQSAVRNH